jgi:hypothetical protein
MRCYLVFIMKTSLRSFQKIGLAALAVSFALISTSGLWADDHWNNQWDSRHHYRRDNYGYYDGDHYHHYETWHSHRGYWDTHGGTRIFINVD